MIQIYQTTTKTQLLSELAQLSNQKGDLVINIENLPNFLKTQIAFNIFNHQISNYPRSILWHSSNPKILEYLQNCKAKLNQPQSNNVDFNTTPKQLTSTSNLVKIDPNKIPIKSEISKRSELTKDSFYLDHQEVFQDNQKPISTQQWFEVSTEEFFKMDKSRILSENKKVKTIIPTTILTNKTNEKIPQLEYSTNLNQEKLETKLSLGQNFDSWLEKIESTKQRLANIEKRQKIRKKIAFLKFNGFIATSLVTACLITVCLIFFPTEVYSFQIQPFYLNRTSMLRFNKSDFNSQNLVLKVTDSIPPSGQKTVENTRSSGKVTLINNSNSDIRFTSGGIILVGSNGREYRQLNGDSSTITVPAQSNLNGSNVIIEIEASDNGSDFNLPTGSTFKLYNLRKDMIGSSFSAVSNEEISTIKTIPSKVVTENDLSVLKTKVENQVTQKIQAEIAKINDTGILKRDNWFEYNNTGFEFSHKVGESTTNLTLTAQPPINIFTLSLSKINQKIQEKNFEVSKIDKILRIEDNQISLNGNNELNLEVEYSYLVKQDIDKQEAVKTLNDQDLDIAKTQLQKRYPGITNISKSKSGFSLPGVSSKVEVKIDYTKDSNSKN